MKNSKTNTDTEIKQQIYVKAIWKMHKVWYVTVGAVGDSAGTLCIF